MNAVRKHRLWTAEQRLEQSRKLRERQIWLKSTGPRTIQGKINSSANARHADYAVRVAERAEMRAIKRYLRTQKSYTDLLNIFHKQWDRLNDAQHTVVEAQLFFLENELIDIEREIFGGLTYSELMAGNIIPFSRDRRQ